MARRAYASSPPSQPSSPPSGHVTRPSLASRLTDSHRDLVLQTLTGASVTHSDGVRRSLKELGAWKNTEGHREALLHEVQGGDSVAGVALQYGLTAQALRQANRLWSSDSIHLRKTLYIPLDACTIPPAREIIERIEIDGEEVTIVSRALPKKRPPPVAPPPLKPINGSAGRRSASLDLERLPASSRTSMDSNASLYLPETNTTYLSDLPSPTSAASEQLVEVEEAPSPLIERKLKLGLVPQPPSAKEPFFRLSPSASLSELPAERKPLPTAKAKAEAVPMKPATSSWTSSAWYGDDAELALAHEYMARVRVKDKKN